MPTVRIKFGASTTLMGGNNNDVSSTATGVLVADLIDLTGASTGIELSCAQGSRTATDTNGRNAGADATDQAMNQGGQFVNFGSAGSPNSWPFVLDFGGSSTGVDFRVALCTDFSNQDVIDVLFNGVEEITDFDSSGNTGGTIPTATGIDTDGSNLITVAVQEPNQFLYVNAIEFTYTSIGGGGGSVPLFYNRQRAMKV